jgi:hypothetical protein
MPSGVVVGSDSFTTSTGIGVGAGHETIRLGPLGVPPPPPPPPSRCLRVAHLAAEPLRGREQPAASPVKPATHDRHVAGRAAAVLRGPCCPGPFRCSRWTRPSSAASRSRSRRHRGCASWRATRWRDDLGLSLPAVDRRGLAASIAGPDTDGALPARAALTVALDLSDGDVRERAGRAARSGRCHRTGPAGHPAQRPRPGAVAVEPNYLAVVEFDPPDLPWLFTPAAPGAEDRLRPWCVLVPRAERATGSPSSTSAARCCPCWRSPTRPMPEPSCPILRSRGRGHTRRSCTTTAARSTSRQTCAPDRSPT